MRSVLEQKKEIVLDASNVEIVDSAALQLLLVFLREAKARGISIRWTKISAVFRDTVILLDIHNHLGV
jgi:anti-anti-sigma regulatory factor